VTHATGPPVTGTARLAGQGPAAEQLPRGPRLPLAPCDATASGAEDAQVRLAKGSRELLLCGHHYAGLASALAGSGWQVTHDNRGR
jgi:hypothetical protein